MGVLGKNMNLQSLQTLLMPLIRLVDAKSAEWISILEFSPFCFGKGNEGTKSNKCQNLQFPEVSHNPNEQNNGLVERQA